MLRGIFILLWGILAFCGVAASAEPLALHIDGEVAPELQADPRALEPYAQSRITHITFHHEGFAGDDATLFAKASQARAKQTIGQRVRNINHDHAGAAGLGMIAYHYAVDAQGRIARGRPVRYAPATKSTTTDGRTPDFAGHFAVVALGDFNHESLTPQARLAYIRVMSEAQRAFRVPTANIRPHLDYAATACPGTHIMEEADRLPFRVLAFSLQAELAARGCTRQEPDGQWTAQDTQTLARLVPGVTGPGDSPLFILIDNPGLLCQ